MDSMCDSILEACRSSDAEAVNAVAYAGVEQVLSKLIGGYSFNQSIAVVDIQVDGRVRLISVPSLSGDAVAINAVEIPAVIGGSIVVVI